MTSMWLNSMKSVIRKRIPLYWWKIQKEKFMADSLLVPGSPIKLGNIKLIHNINLLSSASVTVPNTFSLRINSPSNVIPYLDQYSAEEDWWWSKTTQTNKKNIGKLYHSLMFQHLENHGQNNITLIFWGLSKEKNITSSNGKSSKSTSNDFMIWLLFLYIIYSILYSS